MTRLILYLSRKQKKERKKERKKEKYKQRYLLLGLHAKFPAKLDVIEAAAETLVSRPQNE